jgi:ABC-type sugar transport system permease subunit
MEVDGTDTARTRSTLAPSVPTRGSPTKSAAADSTTERELETGPRVVRPPALWLAFALLLALSVIAVPMALVSSFGVELSQNWPLPSMGLLGVALMGPVGVGLLAAAIGLVLLRAWSRMLGIVCLLCGVVYYAKLVVPVYANLNWEHRAASTIATVVGIFQGVPLLLFLIALASLFARSLRRALASTRPASRSRARSKA